jgi:hypothetical protein
MFLATNLSNAGAALVAEELAVIQAMAVIMNQESARPYDFLYHESDFTARPHIASSMANPDRTQFCGLSRDEGLTLVRQLAQVNSEPVEFDKGVAKSAGLAIGHKRLERFRYLSLSRVVFAPDKLHAWLAADLNGQTGAVYRMDLVGGEWTKSERCGGWLRAE